MKKRKTIKEIKEEHGLFIASIYAGGIVFAHLKIAAGILFVSTLRLFGVDATLEVKEKK